MKRRKLYVTEIIFIVNELAKWIFFSPFLSWLVLREKNPFSAPTSTPPGCAVVLSIPRYRKEWVTDSYTKTTRQGLISNLFSLIGRFGRWRPTWPATGMNAWNKIGCRLGSDLPTTIQRALQVNLSLYYQIQAR